MVSIRQFTPQQAPQATGKSFCKAQTRSMHLRASILSTKAAFRHPTLRH